MIYFVLYDSGGSIRQQGRGAAAPSVAGLTALEVQSAVDAAAYYVASGVLTAYTEAQRIARAAQPHRNASWDNATMAWVDNRTEARAWADVRAQRDALLAGCDWITVRAVDQGVAVPAEWATYRQALRDITEQLDPFDITWPVAPA